MLLFDGRGRRKNRRSRIKYGMKLSVTLIVRNEEANLRRLLPQLGFADEIVVADTGSDDNTVQVALAFGAKVVHCPWQNDFSAARNFAINHATGDYIMWLDADDVLPPSAQNALRLFADSSPSADIYYMRYRMQGDFPFWFWRERIVRRCSRCKFVGFIHEAIVPFGRTSLLDAEVVHSPSATHEKRNLDIYRQAISQGKRMRPRDRYYFARTLVENGLVDEALPILRTFASNRRALAQDRCDALKLLAQWQLSQGNGNAARRYLARACRLQPPSGEICCLFAQSYFDVGLWQQAAEWYMLALAAPAQTGFVNEYYTGFLPNVQLSVCQWRLGNRAEARRYHLAAKAIAPRHPTVVANDRYF